MTYTEKENIRQLREKGVSYSEISRLLDISVNSVSSYCKRHNLGGRQPKILSTDNLEISVCQQCGGAVHQNIHRKKKKFCSDQCRNMWWRLHSQEIQRKSLVSGYCPICGSEFHAYKSADQKYCSRKCYGKSKEVTT